MSENFDLFGHPVREGFGKRGRPPYQPTESDRNKIKLLLALGWSNERVANGVGISPATLKRYFRAELKERDAMRDRLEARRFEIAMEQANCGNIGALRELGRLIERSDLMTIPPKPATTPEQRDEKLGKKERAVRDAQTAHENNSWGSLIQ